MAIDSNLTVQRMQLVKRLIDAYQRDATLDEVLGAITQGLVDEFDAAFARIWLIERQVGGQEYLLLKASAGLYTNLHGLRSRIPLPDSSKLGQIVAARQGHFTNDTYNDPGVLDHNWARENDLVALAGYPLMRYQGDENTPFGVLILYRRRPITDEEYQILDVAVAQIVNIVLSHRGLEKVTPVIVKDKLSIGRPPSFWARLFGRG